MLIIQFLELSCLSLQSIIARFSMERAKEEAQGTNGFGEGASRRIGKWKQTMGWLGNHGLEFRLKKK